MISRPAEGEYDPYFDRYIQLVPEGNFLELLQIQTRETRDYFEKLSEDTGNYTYAAGKWSIKEVLGHVIDTERVFAYRALCISRGEQQPLPGFDQNDYAAAANYQQIALSRVVQHYTALRASTLFLLEQISESAWNRTGISNQKRISLRALAYIIAGHERHHMRVLAQLYK